MDEESPCLLSTNTIHSLLTSDCSVQDDKCGSEDSAITSITDNGKGSLQRPSSIQEIYDSSSDYVLNANLRNCNEILRMVKQQMTIQQQMKQQHETANDPKQSDFLNQMHVEVRDTLQKVLRVVDLAQDSPMRIKFSAIQRTAAALLKENEVWWNSSKVLKKPAKRPSSSHRKGRKRQKQRTSSGNKALKKSTFSRDESSDSDVMSITGDEIRTEETELVDLTVGSSDNETTCLSREDLDVPFLSLVDVRPSVLNSSTTARPSLDLECSISRTPLSKRRCQSSKSPSLSSIASPDICRFQPSVARVLHNLNALTDSSQSSTKNSHLGSQRSNRSSRSKVESRDGSESTGAKSASGSRHSSQNSDKQAQLSSQKVDLLLLGQKSDSASKSPERAFKEPEKESSCKNKFSAEMTEAEYSTHRTSPFSNLPLVLTSGDEEPPQNELRMNRSFSRSSERSASRRSKPVTTEQVSDAFRDKLSALRDKRRSCRHRSSTVGLSKSSKRDEGIQAVPEERLSILVNCTVSASEEQKLNLILKKFGEQTQRVPTVALTKLFSSEQIVSLIKVKK